MLPAPQSLPPARNEAPRHFEVYAYPLSLRLAETSALLLSAGNILYLIARILFDIVKEQGGVAPEFVLQGLLMFSLVPGVMAWILGQLARATVRLEPERIVVTLRQTRLEIPYAAIDSLRLWRLPLPWHGFSLRMKSGRTFEYGVGAPDLLPLLAALGEVGLSGAALAERPGLRYAQARVQHVFWRRRGAFLAFKFGLFPLLPTSIVFRLDQYIRFGGAFGEYRMHGLKAYLGTFATQWSRVITLLVLYACLWRAVVEGVAIAATWLAPSRARGVRKVAEIACLAVYIVGVPAIILARILL